MSNLDHAMKSQHERNIALIGKSHYMRDQVDSKVLPFRLDIAKAAALTDEQVTALQALEITAARVAIQSLASLAKLGELDHLGGGLDLIPALTQVVACTDYRKIEYTIENAHCSIGYYSVLAAFGFLKPEHVVGEFRRGLDIAGHVSWVPGGTPLNGGRLGVMIPAAVGQALGKRAHFGEGSWVICHCGDAGWISGQALNGFNAADLHLAPVTFIMQRNGIQLSGSNKQIMDKDPRPIVRAMGLKIIEIESLHDQRKLYGALRKGYELAQNGRPSLIYPTGKQCPLQQWGEEFGIGAELKALAEANKVKLTKKVWVPGALMSYRDVAPMIECVFLCNDLPGGKGHHDGGMKGRDEAAVLANPMLKLSAAQTAALAKLQQAEPRLVVTKARPAPGVENLLLDPTVLKAVALPPAGKPVSPRNGTQLAYELIAKAHPKAMYVISCDLDPSTKLDKAKALVPADHKFEMSIEEQVSAIMANGIAMSGQYPALVVFSTFAAFFEGIAREGLEMWRYQRNLNGVNEGLNVAMHLSHVGAITGRDHFSGWSLDWINLAIGYLPYLHRFYAPADARGAFVAVIDLAANYGGHIIGVPRENLPILTSTAGKPVFNADQRWEPLSALRQHDGATKAILAFGATAFLAIEVAAKLGGEVDAYVVNGLPLNDGQLEKLAARYTGGIVTIEDGLIGDRYSGLRGFAGLVSSRVREVPVAHVGIVDPRIAPAEGFEEVWQHFGLTADNLLAAVRSL